MTSEHTSFMPSGPTTMRTTVVTVSGGWRGGLFFAPFLLVLRTRGVGGSLVIVFLLCCASIGQTPGSVACFFRKDEFCLDEAAERCIGAQQPGCHTSRFAADSGLPRMGTGGESVRQPS